MTECAPIDEMVRAAYTARVRAEVARLLADSLAARTAATGRGAGASGACRKLRRDAAEHDRDARQLEGRVALMRQLEHDGRL